jgi:hypothetical protein
VELRFYRPQSVGYFLFIFLFYSLSTLLEILISKVHEVFANQSFKTMVFFPARPGPVLPTNDLISWLFDNPTFDQDEKVSPGFRYICTIVDMLSSDIL